MKLITEWGTPNESFAWVYTAIENGLKSRFGSVECRRLPGGHNPHPGGPNGVSTMKIINGDTKKMAVVSFWDRGLDVFCTGIGWEDNTLVHLYGGLGMPPDDIERYKQERGVKHTPLQYPLDWLQHYKTLDEKRQPYDFSIKIPKAAFIGAIYHPRDEFIHLLEKTGLFYFLPASAGLRGPVYYEEMNKYAATLSFNGAGEYSIRDFESMGLGIPVIRSQPICRLHEPLIENVTYIKGSQPSDMAFIVYPGTTFKDITDQFYEATKAALANPQLLTNVAYNGYEYFDRNVRVERIAQLFLTKFDINDLV